MWGGGSRTLVGDDFRERGPNPPRWEDAEIADLLDPVGLTPERWLEPVGRTIHAGREAIRIRGTPRKEDEMDVSPATI